MNKKMFLICLGMALHFCVFAGGVADTLELNEVNDTNINNQIQFIYENNLDNNTEQLFILDTSLNGFQRYNLTLWFARFGSTQRAGSTLSEAEGCCSGNFVPTGIDIGIHNFDIYEFNSAGIRYFNTRSPFTELFYVNGSKNEQILRVLHTQNINKELNMGVEYRRSGYEGFYARQKYNNSNFAFFTWYKSKTGRYVLLANAILNNLKVEENGGIREDSLFENTTGLQKNIIEVNLDSAQNNWKGKSFFVKQYFYSRISHSFSYQEKSFNYEDGNPESGFYDSIYLDSSKTSDQIRFTKIENRVSAETGNVGTKHASSLHSPSLHAGLGIKHQYLLFNQNRNTGDDTLFNNLIIRGNLRMGRYLSIGGDYVFYGNNKDDFSADAYFTTKGDDESGAINIYSALSKKSPWIIHNMESSNHFRWENDFKKTELLYGRLEYTLAKRNFKSGISFYHINNYIYFNNAAMPEQLFTPIQIFSAYLVKGFRWGKWNFNNEIIYQYVPDNNKIRVPEIVSVHSLYFEDYLFKKALLIQTGTDVFFNTGYFADAYMPATGQFYLQDEKETGNYPYIDVFVNFKIKRARIFFKIEHVNSGLMGNTYYMIPHYPMPDRAFKFGISWMFYD